MLIDEPVEHLGRSPCTEFICSFEAVAELYDAHSGRPSIDPEVAPRLMLAGLLLGIVHDRRLMRGAQANLATRWLCSYRLA